jgi:hypothetical protein
MSNVARRTARAVTAAAIVAGSLVIGAGAAGAATPVSQGCVGSTVSNLSAVAHDAGIPYGQLIVGFAQDPFSRPGLGDGIQQLQAGLVPDEVVPNTCN